MATLVEQVADLEVRLTALTARLDRLDPPPAPAPPPGTPMAARAPVVEATDEDPPTRAAPPADPGVPDRVGTRRGP